MLQRGFLKSRTKEGQKTSVAKTSRLLLVLGVIFMLSAMFFMMSNAQQDATVIHVCVPVIIAGICLVIISIWLQFFSQNKKRHSKSDF